MLSYVDQMNYMGRNYSAPPQTMSQGISNAFSVDPQNQTNPATAGLTPSLTGWQKFGYAMDGLGAISSLWGGIQQNKLAKQQLALNTQNYNENMNNSIQSYNTALEDRIRARYAMEGRSDQADAYIDKNRLSRT